MNAMTEYKDIGVRGYNIVSHEYEPVCPGTAYALITTARLEIIWRFRSNGFDIDLPYWACATMKDFIVFVAEKYKPLRWGSQNKVIVYD